jgi:demethoxyubiquinone hydroxylase (CLK1/Coq7/Cat5 family)
MSAVSRNSVLLVRYPLKCVPARFVSTVEAVAERKAMLDRMIRVDHAGEYGADRIYAGQVSAPRTGLNGPQFGASPVNLSIF